MCTTSVCCDRYMYERQLPLLLAIFVDEENIYVISIPLVVPSFSLRRNGCVFHEQPQILRCVCVLEEPGLLLLLLLLFYLRPTGIHPSSFDDLCPAAALQSSQIEIWEWFPPAASLRLYIPTLLAFALLNLPRIDQTVQKRMAKERAKREQEKKLAKMLGFKGGRGRGRGTGRGK